MGQRRRANDSTSESARRGDTIGSVRGARRRNPLAQEPSREDLSLRLCLPNLGLEKAISSTFLEKDFSFSFLGLHIVSGFALYTRKGLRQGGSVFEELEGEQTGNGVEGSLLSTSL
ncbi:hypothetical protein TWF694_008323 [Orbilia ellipsospora]|uniref:Uncharacterized protein n=1 Tax=Orbilia ellipsospora TaxID=2528407 RepID=A0AAV9XH53_9PEZI